MMNNDFNPGQEHNANHQMTAPEGWDKLEKKAQKMHLDLLHNELTPKQLNKLGRAVCPLKEKFRLLFKLHTNAIYASKAQTIIEKRNIQILTNSSDHPQSERIQVLSDVLKAAEILPNNHLVDVNNNSIKEKINIILSFLAEAATPHHSWLKRDNNYLLPEKTLEEILREIDLSRAKKILNIAEFLKSNPSIQTATIHTAMEAVKVIGEDVDPTFTLESLGRCLNILQTSINLHTDNNDQGERSHFIQATAKICNNQETSNQLEAFVTLVTTNNDIRQSICGSGNGNAQNLVEEPSFASAVVNMMNRRDLLPTDEIRALFDAWLQNNPPPSAEALEHSVDNFLAEKKSALTQAAPGAIANICNNLDDPATIIGFQIKINDARTIMDKNDLLDLYNDVIRPVEDLSEDSITDYIDNVHQFAASAQTYLHDLAELDLTESTLFKKILSEEKPLNNEALTITYKNFITNRWNDFVNANKNLSDDQKNAGKQMVDSGFHYLDSADLKTYKNIVAEAPKAESVFSIFIGTTDSVQDLIDYCNKDPQSKEAKKIVKKFFDFRDLCEKYNMKTHFSNYIEVTLPTLNKKNNLEKLEELAKGGVLGEFLRAFDTHAQIALNGGLSLETYVMFVNKEISSFFEKNKKGNGMIKKKDVLDRAAEYGKNLENALLRLKINTDKFDKQNIGYDIKDSLNQHVGKGLLGALDHLNSVYESILADRIVIIEEQPSYDAKTVGGPTYAGKYQEFLSNKKINIETFSALDDDGKLEMMARLIAEELTQKAGFECFSPEFIYQYLQIPVSVLIKNNIGGYSFRMDRLYKAIDSFDPKKTKAIEQECNQQKIDILNSRNFEQFFKDWESAAFDSEKKIDLKPGLYTPYQLMNQNNELTPLMKALSNSEKFIDLMSHSTNGPKNRGYFANETCKQYLNFIKNNYSPTIVASVFKNTIENNQNFLNIDISKDPNVLLVINTETIKRNIDPTVDEKEGGTSLKNELIKMIRGTSKQLTENQLNYANQVIGFAVQQFIEGASQESILDNLTAQKINLNLKNIQKQNIDNLPAKLERISKNLKFNKSKINHKKISNILLDNPLHIITVLLPEFLENLLPAEAKTQNTKIDRIVKFQAELVKLENAGNKIEYVKNIGTIIGGVYVTFSMIAEQSEIGVNDRINNIFTNLLKIAEKKGRPENVIIQPPQNKINELVNGAEQTIYSKIAELLNDYAVNPLTDLVIEASETKNQVDELQNQIQMANKAAKKAEKDAQTEIRKQIKEIENRLESEKNKLNQPGVAFLMNYLPYISRFADQFVYILKTFGSLAPIANKAIQKFGPALIRPLLDKHATNLTEDEKDAVVQGITSILNGLLLAAPEILKHHDTDTYVKFIKNLNEIVQGSKKGQELLNGLPGSGMEEKVSGLIWATFGEFFKESKEYTQALLRTLNAAQKIYEDSPEIIIIEHIGD